MNRLDAIDGLRAYAVIPVLLFHVGFSQFAGGFVGVDIFFVISGFVITRMLLGQIDAGTFSAKGFALSRVRRLLPATLATVAVSGVAAALLFSPADLAKFGQSAVATVAGVSNVYFWWTTDYWTSSKWVMPLLHTWSLGIEIQFYLVWPLLLYFTPRRFLPWVIGAIAVVGFVVTEFFIVWQPTGTFFLPWFRACEFAVGALVVFLPRVQKATDLSLLAGLALGAYAVLSTTEDNFPGMAAVPACLATALCIYGSAAPRLGLLLDNRIAVWLGRASYSIYLVHWPIIVFWRYYSFREPTFLDKFGLVAASLLVAAALHYLIEMPVYRSKRHPRLLLASVLTASALIASPAASMVGGWTWRIDRQLDANSRAYGGFGCPFPFCTLTTGTGKEIAIIGDSHARMYFSGFKAIADGRNPISVWHFESFCRFVNQEHQNVDRGYNCEERLNRYLDYVAAKKIETLVVAYRWTRVLNRSTPEEVALLTRTWLDLPRMKSVKRVVLVLQVPEHPDGKSPSACYIVPPLLSDRNCATVPINDFRTQRAMNRKLLDAMRAQLADRVEFTVANPYAALCTATACRRMVGRRALYSDEHHLSVHGSRLVVKSWVPKLNALTGQTAFR